MSSDSRSSYQEFHAPPTVRDRLVCLWVQTVAGGASHAHSVLPDGCVDIVWIGLSAPVVAGPATHRIVVDLPSGTNVVGVRFRPGWAAASLGVPADELLNTHDIRLTDLRPRYEPDLAEADAESNRAVSTVPGDKGMLSHAALLKLHALTRWTLRNYSNAPCADSRIQLAIKRLASSHSGFGCVQALEREVGWSTRHLQRRFRAAVGYGPKTFQRIMRLQRLLWLASNAVTSRSLAEIAATVGYADQAHMCREVRDLTDATPQTVLARRDSTIVLSDLFNTADYGVS